MTKFDPGISPPKKTFSPEEATHQTHLKQNNIVDRTLSFYSRIVKRVFDLACVILAAPVVVPLIALLAIVVFLQDFKNPFYKQARVGKGGRIYTMWKMRSMVANADEMLASFVANDHALKAEWEVTQKLKVDPRVTRLGRVMRASSLDELPQLWNVFKGDMSLVGPRPIMPEQSHLYPGTDYYKLHPGITGLWQVSSRNETSFVDRARFDALYVKKLSLWTDLKILVATVFVVIKATGY